MKIDGLVDVRFLAGVRYFTLELANFLGSPLAGLEPGTIYQEKVGLALYYFA